ncbi:MAG: orotidine 5'-phosphate decarboxylase [Candidatus Woesearchaeota archaeon]|jgi:orotidine-5'-phosphate decarboxylase|nr:orotidine 5'-phosphate decarboxylase [Candidatus Woesearchaeota archaeon]MDP7180072.1 orotidine 5'-phosphate decarboxylase [Candidatus Woesearchaeota archaeon]
MSKIIKQDRSVIVACDVGTIEKLKELVEETSNVDGIGGFKIGFSLVVPFGVEKVVSTINDVTDLPIIYDHQKAGTDIPDLADTFMKSIRGVNAVILFPQAGPETEKSWITAAKKAGYGVIVGGEMTHKGYLVGDGGFIADNAPERIYTIASAAGVNDFVVPGNKPDRIKEYREMLERFKPVFYSPGLVAQGGKLTESAKAAGERWHAIVGRGIYQQKDMHNAAKELVKEII